MTRVETPKKQESFVFASTAVCKAPSAMVDDERPIAAPNELRTASVHSSITRHAQQLVWL